LIWSTRAKAEIHGIAKYIEKDSKQNADAMVRRIMQATRRARERPHAGRIVPEWKRAAFREVIVYPYRVIYWLSADTVAIAMVRHSRRQLPRRPPVLRFK
jgi:plasmid stabilization system protein ParE